MLADPRLSGALVTIAQGGLTTPGMAAIIDAQIATVVAQGGSDPGFALINLGANDVSSTPVEATYKTALEYIVEALNTQWPGIKILLTQVWRRDKDAECDSIDGWMSDVAGLYGYVSLGTDERIWLEGGDDGATMTLDGTHYSTAGVAEAATQQLAALATIGY